jgi:hypothetical protein
MLSLVEKKKSTEQEALGLGGILIILTIIFLSLMVKQAGLSRSTLKISSRISNKFPLGTHN